MDTSPGTQPHRPGKSGGFDNGGAVRPGAGVTPTECLSFPPERAPCWKFRSTHSSHAVFTLCAPDKGVGTVATALCGMPLGTWAKVEPNEPAPRVTVRDSAVASRTGVAPSREPPELPLPGTSWVQAI